MNSQSSRHKPREAAPAAHEPVAAALVSSTASAHPDVDSSPRQLAQHGRLTQLQPRRNHTGMPDDLKQSVETLSGMDLSDVKVHRNSPRPAQLQAHAFAQGNQVHLAPGQEAHLPHEAWHVVQQRQGRVRPTTRLGGIHLNDDAGLEQEADSMGRRAVLQGAHLNLESLQRAPASGMASTQADSAAPVQRSGKGALAGAAAGAGLGAFGFFAGPLVGSITTTVGAIIGGIVGHLKTDGPLPRSAHARKDKTLAPVSTSELDSILEQTTHTSEEIKLLLKQVGDKLIEQGLLFWTAGNEEHCEVFIDNEKSDTYRVRVVVVVPRRPTREATDPAMQRGAAVHELVHALEVVSRIGGIDNLGKDIPKVEESGKVLRGNQLQWSKLPGEETSLMATTLKRQMNELIRAEEEKGTHRNKIEFFWTYYMQRLDYAIARRHEVPTVIVQLVEDIHAQGDQPLLEDTEFYRTLIAYRHRLYEAL
jgi:hypothetical protein